MGSDEHKKKGGVPFVQFGLVGGAALILLGAVAMLARGGSLPWTKVAPKCLEDVSVDDLEDELNKRLKE